jgi:hypothetical protein
MINIGLDSAYPSLIGQFFSDDAQRLEVLKRDVFVLND